jgi:hypothetical protein
MILSEENYKEIIISYSENEWKSLLDLIPVLEGSEKYVDMVSRVTENGAITHPYNDQGDLVSTFLKIVYEIPIVINFDWSSWEEGRKIASDRDFDFDTIDIPTKCKLITAFVRNDRFCDGVLDEVFESGVILKILKSIKRQLKF